MCNSDTIYGHTKEVIGREKTFKKHCKEADEKGLWLIGSGKTKAYRTYQFKNCKHIQEFATSNIQKKYNPICRTCTPPIDYKKIAKEKGIEVIGSGKSSNIFKCRFKDCQHVQDISASSLLKNNPVCRTCKPPYDHEKEAEENGLEIIKEGKNRNYKTYRFKDCQHVQEISLKQVRSGWVVCRTCKPCYDHEKEAEENGLEIIGAGENVFKRTYRFKDCQHVQEIAVSKVRTGSFICRKCNTSYLEMPSSVYVFKIESTGFEWLKIGVTKNIEKRIKDFGLPADAEVKVVLEMPTATGFAALEIEKTFHNLFREYKLDADYMKEHYHTITGHTECFEIEALPLIA